MIGKNTAIYDNPKLTVRKIKGKNPIRLIFDRNLEIPKTHNIFNLKSKTIILTNQLIVKNKSNALYQAFFLGTSNTETFQNKKQRRLTPQPSTLLGFVRGWTKLHQQVLTELLPIDRIYQQC